MSDINRTGASTSAEADRKSVADAARREGEAARDTAARAAETLRKEGASLGEGVRQRAIEGAEEGKAAAASSLSDFTAAIRKASEELGERDQSMAAGLARQAASGLEQAADAIQGKSVQELTRSVADFARRQPGAFLIGAALAGVALGRFARASSDHAGPLGPDHSRPGSSHDASYDDHRRREAPGSAAHGASPSGSGTAPKPFDASGERHGSGSGGTGAATSGSTGTSTGTANPAASSSQADAGGLSGGAGTSGSSLNRPGTSGSTSTTGLSGSPSSTGNKA